MCCGAVHIYVVVARSERQTTYLSFMFCCVRHVSCRLIVLDCAVAGGVRGDLSTAPLAVAGARPRASAVDSTRPTVTVRTKAGRSHCHTSAVTGMRTDRHHPCTYAAAMRTIQLVQGCVVILTNVAWCWSTLFTAPCAACLSWPRRLMCVQSVRHEFGQLLTTKRPTPQAGWLPLRRSAGRHARMRRP